MAGFMLVDLGENRLKRREQVTWEPDIWGSCIEQGTLSLSHMYKYIWIVSLHRIYIYYTQAVMLRTRGAEISIEGAVKLSEEMVAVPHEAKWTVIQLLSCVPVLFLVSEIVSVHFEDSGAGGTGRIKHWDFPIYSWYEWGNMNEVSICACLRSRGDFTVPATAKEWQTEWYAFLFACPPKYNLAQNVWIYFQQYLLSFIAGHQ